jgi:soluble lytic murein transglycosylase
MLARYGAMLTPEDHVRRADILLYGAQGPAAREILILLPPDQMQLAQTRMALRSGASNANEMVAALPANQANDPGVAFERASYYRQRSLESLALAQVPKFPRDLAHGDMADRIWAERYRLVLYALRNSDSAGAYAAAANSGLTTGAPAADAEFYAGWIALTRLKNPTQADIHFGNLERIGQSPITRGRAMYWRGRAAEARGDRAAAQAFYGAGAKYNTTFYGQLSGEKVNGGRLTLGSDPVLTQADRARFESRDTVRAARLLYDIGNRDLFRTFVLALDDILPTVEEQALLVDLARGYGDQDTSMKVVRTAAQRGFILPERGYPLRNPPSVMGAPEPALTLGITRQESGFDPMARSGADARGMMQLLPATAASEARRLGMSFDNSMLYQADYNMQLGQAFLGRQINNFSGSYPMAIAAYNAGPGRPPQWVTFCGDPRGSTDPIDFVECIPFSETRNYVMRVMEGMQVYRARLNNGSAPITLTTDLKRGGYGSYAGPTNTPAPARPTSAGASMAPIPNP